LAMGLPDDADIETIATGPTGPDVQFTPGDMTTFPIQASQESLGEMTVFSGPRQLAPGDRNTLALLAQELGTVAKTQFLMEQTKLLAQTDALTQLYNRRHTSATLEAEVARANRYGTPLSVLICDIDHFKSINDRFGHNAGDEVIRQVAKVLGASIRRIDLAGRWGGEEFVVLLPSTPLDGAAVVGERIRTAVEALDPVQGTLERITVSVGVAEHERRKNAVELIEQADKSLYRAKQQGRNRVELYIAPNGEKPEGEEHSSQV